MLTSKGPNCVEMICLWQQMAGVSDLENTPETSAIIKYEI